MAGDAMSGRRGGVCTGRRKSFPQSAVARKRRRSLTKQQATPTPPTTTAISNIYNIPPLLLQEILTSSRSFCRPPLLSNSQLHSHLAPGVVSSPFRRRDKFPRESRSTGKFDHTSRAAIDRRARHLLNDPRPRGNDTALVRTWRLSEIAREQALASCF
jgi:hypothetical protein